MSATHNNDNQEQPSVIKNKLYFCCTKKCQRYYNKTTHDNISIMNTDLSMKKKRRYVVIVEQAGQYAQYAKNDLL